MDRNLNKIMLAPQLICKSVFGIVGEPEEWLMVGRLGQPMCGLQATASVINGIIYYNGIRVESLVSGTNAKNQSCRSAGGS